jgi:4-hydroxy-tetrahydrodipicolinate reductase
MEPLRIVQMGIGAIGREVCRLVLDRLPLHLVGAIDTNPDLVGRSLSGILGLKEDCGVVVSNDTEAVLEASEPDVVVHTTSSRLPDVFRQIEQAVMHGANVISSTEELLYPRLNRPGEAAKLELVALDNKVAILGTGVNPGFVLDTLAVMSTAVCREVERIEGRRIVDAATRRQPLQRKIGAGMAVAEFESLAAQGKMGHVGLTESVALIARGMDWRWQKIEQKTEPVIADREIRTDFAHVLPGQVAGIRNTAWAIVEGREKIRLELQMYLGASEPYDEITIHGEPNMVVRIPGGTPGDIATAAILVNAIPAIAEAPPGLLTMLDIPILRCRASDQGLER